MAKRIVIIEDDPNILELLIFILEAEGYQISPFATGIDAAEIGLLNPDMVLLDVSLIGYPKTGDQICGDLKKLLATSKIPVMLLSAEKDLAGISTACFSDDFLTKPFDIDELVNKVKILSH